MMERLQKILSRAGVASRRKIEKFILEGKVEVDFQVVKDLGFKCNADEVNIKVNGEYIELKKTVFKYIFLNKPIDFYQ